MVIWALMAFLMPIITVAAITHSVRRTLIAFVLTMLFWFPGAIYAYIVIRRRALYRT